MHLKVRRVSFILNQEDYVKLKDCHILSKLFYYKGTMIVEKPSDEDVEKSSFEITGAQFPHQKLYMLQKALPTLRFTFLSDANWVENGILKSKTGRSFFVFVF